GLSWTVALDEGRDFLGRSALGQQKSAGVPRQLSALVMDERGVLRHGQKVLTPARAGATLSSTISPTMSKAIALAKVPDVGYGPGAEGVRVDIRGKEVPVRVVAAPFVKNGRPAPGIES